MYSLLIVDDEHHIIDGLKVMVEWKAYGITIIHTAVSFHDAVERAVEVKPDIALVDVKINDK